MKLSAPAPLLPLLILLFSNLTASGSVAQQQPSTTTRLRAPQVATPPPFLGPKDLTSQASKHWPLNNYDCVSVLIPDADIGQLSVAYTAYGVDNPNDVTTVFIDANEELYLRTEQIIFNRVGAPGTPESKNNSFSTPQPADFKFYGSDLLGGSPFIGTYGFIKASVPPYNDQLDPSMLDLPNGEVVDVGIYLSFKSECINNVCPEYRLNTESAYIIPKAKGNNTLAVLSYNQLPKPGDSPNHLIILDDTTKFFKKSHQSGALTIQFRPASQGFGECL